jgi:glutathione S-transferase
MIQLFEVEWSPFCIVQRRILEYGAVPFRSVCVPVNDRSRIWRLTKGRYYQVPVLKDASQVLFETHPDSQVLAKYLDSRFNLRLFPRESEGIQDVLWRYFESEIEGVGFKLNDIHWREFVPAAEHCGFVRHKERRFGRGCLDQWREQQSELLAQLQSLLIPAEKMLMTRPFLLGPSPIFVDFCLYGMLANFLFSGHYSLPEVHRRLQEWHTRMGAVRRQANP